MDGCVLRRSVLSSTTRAVLTEAVGIAVLIMAVVGSGIAAVDLTDDVGLQPAINAIATVAALGVLIAVALPISGASFNPVVTFADVVRGNLSARRGGAYVVAQLAGGALGTVLAHLMFERSTAAVRSVRGGWGRLLGELWPPLAWSLPSPLSIARCCRSRSRLDPRRDLFTSSTSFANPALTIGRAFTDSFSGIAGTRRPVVPRLPSSSARCSDWASHASSRSTHDRPTHRPLRLRAQRRPLADGRRLPDCPVRGRRRRPLRRLHARRPDQPGGRRGDGRGRHRHRRPSSPKSSPTRPFRTPTSSSPWAAATPARSIPASATRTGFSTIRPAGRWTPPARSATRSRPGRGAAAVDHVSDPLAERGSGGRGGIRAETMPNGVAVVSSAQ